MSPFHILNPVLAMAALTLFVVVRMGITRTLATRSGSVPVEFYRLFEGEHEPEKLRAQTRHVPNLFEIPVLFYIGCILAFVTGTVDLLLVSAAWLFVLTRWAHSCFHLTSNVLLYRTWSFVAGIVVIIFMWLMLSIRLIS